MNSNNAPPAKEGDSLHSPIKGDRYDSGLIPVNGINHMAGGIA